MKLSIIIPTYNEAENIEEIIHYVQLVNYPIDYEIVIIDDASIDATYEKGSLAKLKHDQRVNIKLFKNHINMGKGFSIRRGISLSQGEIIIIQDADKEYNPQDIPKLLQPIINNEAEVVYGSRFLKNRHPQGMALPNFLANKFLTRLTNLLFGLQITDMETCYKVFRSDILKSLPLRANRFTFEPEVTALLAKRKIKIKELPIDYYGRGAKEGKKIKTKDFIFAIAILLWHKLNKLKIPAKSLPDIKVPRGGVEPPRA